MLLSGLDLNKNFGNTYSTKLRKDLYIFNYLIDLINNDQQLKRLFRYMTAEPLAKKSKNLSGEVKIQPDLIEKLDKKNTEGNKILFNGAFNPDMQIESQTYCFIHNNGSTFAVKKEGWNTSYFTMEIIIPEDYNTIIDIDTKMEIPRGEAICIILADLLDGKYINDKNYIPYTGNREFSLTDRHQSRLSKTSDGIVYTMIFKSDKIDFRGNKL